MRRVFVSIVALLGIAVAIPGTAAAQDNSSIDQYTENVPGAGGDQPGTQGGAGTGGDDTGNGGQGDGPAPALPADTAADLESQGGAAAATADLAQSTAPDREQRAQAGDRDRPGVQPGSASGGSRAPADDGGGPSVGEVVTGVSDASESGGLGIWLPIILGATLLAAIAFGVSRWRRGPVEPTRA